MPLPSKTREFHNHSFDSTIWNDFRFRDDDIVIATYAKSGTTWMQQIIAQLLFNGDPDLEVAEMSPWMDLRVPPKEIKLPVVEAQTHRRFVREPSNKRVSKPESASSTTWQMIPTKQRTSPAKIRRSLNA